MTRMKSSILIQLFFIPCLLYVRGEKCFEAKCEFHMDIRWARTMVYRTPDGQNAYNVVLDGETFKIAANIYRVQDPLVGTSVSSEDVIAADGFPRNLITINGQFPGPTLEVLEGTKVKVTVTNNMHTETTSLHFHGMRQMENSHMDGVPYVNQCPIMPGQSFTYSFTAAPVGSHWYHSHMGSQRLDGMFGMIIVHQSNPTINNFPLLLLDWTHVDERIHSITNPYDLQNAGTGEHETANHNGDNGMIYGDITVTDSNREDPVEDPATENGATNENDDRPAERPGNALDDGDSGRDDPVQLDRESIVNPYGTESQFLYGSYTLINGKGRYDERLFPLSNFHVSSGSRTRFRLLHAGTTAGFQLHVDGHKLHVMATDGCEMDPVEVDFIFITPGERVDFEIDADQPEGDYNIRVGTGRLGTADAPGLDPVGVLSYINEEETTTTVSDSTMVSCTAETPCFSFNCGEETYSPEVYVNCIPMDQARAIEDQTEFYMPKPGVEIEELFINFGFQIGPNMNGIKHKEPSAHVDQDGRPYIECDTSDCEDGCECTHFVHLEPNKLMQIVLSNYDNEEVGVEFGHHTTHFHGHNFAVMRIGYSDYDDAAGSVSTPNMDIDCGEPLCAQPKWRNDVTPDLNFDRPIIKDTVAVPSLGYSVIRFRVDNPGIWKMHCHVDSHVLQGMALLFVESTPGQKWTENNLPVCTYDFPMPAAGFTPGALGHKTDSEGEKDGFYVTVGAMIGAVLVCILLGAALCAVIIIFCCRGWLLKRHLMPVPTEDPKL